MTKRAMVVLIPNLGPGGAQRVFLQHLEIFSSHYAVTGCVFNWDGSFKSDQQPNILSLDVPKGKNMVDKLYRFLQRIYRLRALKRKLRADISISHMEGADLVNVLSRSGDKAILWIHGTKSHDENISGALGWIRKTILIPMTYQLAERIVTVSKGIRNELSLKHAFTQDRTIVITNGIDLSNIETMANVQLPEKYQPLFQGNVMITHCRLAAQKNLPAMLAVVSKLKQKLPSRLLIVGNGELKKMLVSCCEELGLTVFDEEDSSEINVVRDVYFLSYQQNPFVLLKHASIYVMTSLWEGYPLSLCEAIACGLPVITADCFTGPREIVCPDLTPGPAVAEPVTGHVGVLMPILRASDTAALDLWSDEIVRLLSDEASLKRFRANTSAVARQFDNRLFAEKSLQIVKSVFNN